MNKFRLFSGKVFTKTRCRQRVPSPSSSTATSTVIQVSPKKALPQQSALKNSKQMSGSRFRVSFYTLPNENLKFVSYVVAENFEYCCQIFQVIEQQAPKTII